MNTYKRKCPICKNDKHSLIIDMPTQCFDTHTVFKNVRVAQCSSCGFVLNDTNYSISDLDAYYNIENFYLTSTSAGTGGSTPFDVKRYEDNLSIIGQYLSKEQSICDVGCGKGGFVRYCKSKGYEKACGVEYSRDLTDIAKKEGLAVCQGSAEKIPLIENKKYDCLSFCHVFEHFNDFDAVLSSIDFALSENGLLYIEVPDLSGYKDHIPYPYYWTFIAKEHLNHFTELDIMRLTCYEKLICEKVFVKYDDSYSVPILRMLLQKKQKSEMSFLPNTYRANYYREFLHNSEELFKKHKEVIAKFVQSQEPVYIWGIGAEFFATLSFSELLQCNIKGLLDRNPLKHKLTVLGHKVVSHELLHNLSLNDTVFIFSVLGFNNMEKYLEGISFKGNVFIFK